MNENHTLTFFLVSIFTNLGNPFLHWFLIWVEGGWSMKNERYVLSPQKKYICISVSIYFKMKLGGVFVAWRSSSGFKTWIWIHRKLITLASGKKN